MKRNNKKAIETATPVSNTEIAVAPAQAEAPKELVLVQTEKKPLVIVTGNKAGSASTEEAIPDSMLQDLAAAKLNTVNSIKSLYATGYSRKQIVAAGYNSSTVYRQVGEYIKAEDARRQEELKKLAEVDTQVDTDAVAI